MMGFIWGYGLIYSVLNNSENLAMLLIYLDIILMLGLARFRLKSMHDFRLQEKNKQI